MSPYIASKLKPKDLVLAEVHICRFRERDEDKATSKRQNYSWEHWRAFLELRAVSIIADAPVDGEIEVQEVPDISI